MKIWLSLILTLILLLSTLTGCGDIGAAKSDNGDDTSNLLISDGTTEAEEIDFAQTDADMFTDRDYETDYDESNSIFIWLNGESATTSSDSVKISGTTVTITEEATYVISGTLADGMIIVDAPDTAKLQLVLNGVNINSETSAPLYILEADKVFITLAEGTENTLANGGTFTAIDENNIDSAIFSKQDLTLNGSGYLTVVSPAGHGIVSKDDLVITSGTYNITSAYHSLDANDSIRITGDTFITATAGKDGLHAENTDDASLGFIYISKGTMEIEAAGDGISAGSYMQIADGTFHILAGGGSENGSLKSSDSWGGFRGNKAPVTKQSSSPASPDDESSTSMKGLKSTGSMLVSGGSMTIDSADDSVHSDASITINGGTFEIASGDDAFHAEETLTIIAGTINITESYEGLEALDVAIQGGNITLISRDDGLNAAGGNDSSGTTGGRDGMFNDHGRMGNGMSAASNGSVTISGGTVKIQASGDGIDANGSLTISGGYTVITGPSQGDTATLDYDTTAVITGGTFLGTGASGMAQTFSDSEQGVISRNVGRQTAGTEINLIAPNRDVLATCTPEMPFDVVIFSSPDIISGETYTITVGTTSQECKAD